LIKKTGDKTAGHPETLKPLYAFQKPKGRQQLSNNHTQLVKPMDESFTE
jgi:hypothetical protein